MQERLNELKRLLAQYEQDVILASGDEHAKLMVKIEKTKKQIRTLEAEIDAVQAEPEHSQQRLAVCPYRGLEYFDVQHAANYFGRDAMVDKLLAKLHETNFVVLVGPSGCGKSSLVRAGIQPALARGALPGSRDWHVELFRPGSQPLRALAVPLVAWINPDLGLVDRMTEGRKLADNLQAGALDLDDVFNQFPNPAARYLLVADQFEEAFTLCDDKTLRRAFVQSLLALADRPRLTVLLTVRADFTGHLLADPRLSAPADRGWVNGLPMTEAELRAAIEQPAAQAGAGFEARLADRILTDVAAAPGQLPLLEFALAQLWAHQRADGLLTNAAYDAIGGVSQAIAVHAEEVLASLSVEEQARAPDLFTNLVRVARPEEGAEDTRRRVHLHDLPPGLHPLACRLAGADTRLLVARQDPATRAATVEVVHEALIRQWERLRGWLDANRAYLLWRQCYRADLDRWQVDRDAGALLRGGPLAEAERWRQQHPQVWSDIETAYLDACLAQHQAEEEHELRRVKELQFALR